MTRRLTSRRRLAATERKLVWIFGSPRSGSSWLLTMLGTRSGVTTIDEPGIGSHLGLFAPDIFVSPARTFEPHQLRINDARAQDANYFFAEPFALVWRPQLRSLLLSRFAAQLDRASPRTGWCVIKEPNGSQAADLVMSLLPQSRMLLLLRDGRDVVDSQLDAFGEGSWLGQHGGPRAMSAEDRLAFVEEWSVRWAYRTERVLAAYDAHDPALRLLVRYEDLRTEAAAQVRRIVDWLGIEAGEDFDAMVASLSYEELPAELRGTGKFARKAQPGFWRESLTSAEQEVATRVMAPMLDRLGYLGGVR